MYRFFLHLHLKFGKNAIMTPKKNINMDIKNRRIFLGEFFKAGSAIFKLALNSGFFHKQIF
jgi:hypothetical protein